MYRTVRFPLLVVYGVISLLLLFGFIDTLTTGHALAAWIQGVALLLTIGTTLLLFLDLRREVAFRRAILTVSQLLAATTDSADVLDGVVHVILSLIPSADKCVIHLLDEPGRRLYPRYSSSPDRERVLGMPADQGIAGRALREVRTIIVPDVHREASFLPLQSQGTLRSLLVAPLHAHGRPLGTLSLNSRHANAFSPQDEMLVTTLAVEASAAILQSKLNAEAQEGARHIEAIINNLADGLVLLDPEDRIMRYNPALAHLLGVDVAALTGEQVSASSKVESVRHLATILGRPVHTTAESYERFVEIEEPIRASLKIQVHPIGSSTASQGRIVVIHDCTEELDLAQGDAALLAAAALELSSRLASVRGYATLLATGDGSESAAADWIEQVHGQSARLMRLVQGLYDLSAVQSGQFVSHPENVQVSELVADAVAAATPTAQREGVSLQADYPPGLAALHVDADLLLRVLLQLIECSIRRSAVGGQVSLRVSASLEELTVMVSDDGQLSEPEVHALQNRLTWADIAATEVLCGAVEMYVSRRLLEALGGYLWRTDSAERGTVLQFLLPLLPQSQATPEPSLL